MARSPPTLDEHGKQNLSKLLNDTVNANKTPAVFVGATTAGETLYLDCAGDVVCGSPDSGKVDLDTSESCGRLQCVACLNRFFVTALQLYSTTKFVTTVRPKARSSAKERPKWLICHCFRVGSVPAARRPRTGLAR